MPGFGLQKNMVFEWSGARFRIDRVHSNGDVLLERVEDGVFSIVQRGQLLAEYRCGSISADISGRSQAAPAELAFSRPLDELSQDVQHEVARRRHYLQTILGEGRLVFTKDYLVPLIARAAAEIGDEHPPSVTSFYRWYRRYQREKDARMLVPRFDLRGSRNLKQSDDVLRFASEAIEEAFKTSPRATGPGIYTRLVKKIDFENRTRQVSEHLKHPGLRTLYRMFERVEAYDQSALREGKNAADKRFRLVKNTVKTERILERVEVDHTPLDLFLIDENTWLPLGRPTLTVVIDHFSRMLLGYYLSYGAPSTAAVMGALRHAILPKEPISEVLTNLHIEHRWPCYGIPELMVIDNGLEFHGLSLDEVAFDLGSRIHYCPKHEPRFKAPVERMIKTINYSFAHQLPGTSFARLHERGDYDPQKHALITFAEFNHLFQKWILDDYAQTVHRGTHETPWARWHEGMRCFEPKLPESVKILQRRIGQVKERTLRHDGIVLHGIRYNGDNLASILRAYGTGTKVRVLFDSEDLGDIQVWGPDDQEPVQVLALDQKYARGLTQLQNELIQTTVREKGASQQDPVALQRAREDIITAVDHLLISRKQRDRRRAAAIRGTSSTNPASRLNAKSDSQREDAARETARNAHNATSPNSTPLDFDKPPVTYAFFRPNQKNNEKGVQ